VLNDVRCNIRGDSINIKNLVSRIAGRQPTKLALETVKKLNAHPRVIPCAMLHPHMDSCILNGASVFRRVFQLIIPVYLSLNIVPMFVLKMKEFIKK